MIADIESQLEKIFRETLAQPTLKLTRDSAPRNVNGWDSLAQVRLIIEIEKSFGIRITMADLLRLRNVGDFIDFLEGR